MQEEYRDYKSIMNSVKEKSMQAITQLAYDTWIAPIEIASIQNDVVNLLVPTEFYGNQIKQYEPLLINCFKDITQKIYKLNYVTTKNLEENNTEVVFQSNENQFNSNLKPELTFNNFVIFIGLT